MVLTDKDVIRGAETDEELLIFDVSDEHWSAPPVLPTDKPRWYMVL